MPKSFDLVVIGTGSAGAGVAGRCRDSGWNVAIIDSRPYGGTCALRGCDPKKVLVGATEALDWVHRLQGKGIQATGGEINWSELMRFKRTFTEPVPESNEKWLTQAGIETFHGQARFIGPTAVQVGDDILESKYVHIATGAKPKDLKIPGREHIITSTEFLELEKLPSRILFVGGGYISFEFAHVSARAGAQVTLLHRSARPLGSFDPDLVAMLVERTRKLGVDVQLEAEVCRIESSGNGLTVQASTSGGSRSLETDLVVHGAGRVPDIDDLGLTEAGVEHYGRGVKVNEFLQSVSNPAVYAAGDCAATDGPPLTPVGGHEGGIVAANLLEGNHRKVSYPPIPSLVFTVPPLASVGLQESEAQEQELKFETHFQRTGSWYSSARVGEEYSAYKVLVEEGNGRVLGAHLLGPNAEEMINLFTMAIAAGLKSKDIKGMIFGYPTFASDISYMV
ncbi:NAD(P)/FAD-dependent oxidoreductase [Acidobacteria bacterium AH-259-L09]|nr:NAD(P)/FAD-dependent oxidoreductase [Acidobacteria bacterium AH-259-L09]